jgi:hypothetical protein
MTATKQTHTLASSHAGSYKQHMTYTTAFVSVIRRMLRDTSYLTSSCNTGCKKQRMKANLPHALSHLETSVHAVHQRVLLQLMAVLASISVFPLPKPLHTALSTGHSHC